jgi:hypothetical protein
VILKELIEKYNIPPENIYNADEKGVLLRISKKVLAFFDQDLSHQFLGFISSQVSGQGVIMV